MAEGVEAVLSMIGAHAAVTDAAKGHARVGEMNHGVIDAAPTPMS